MSSDFITPWTVSGTKIIHATSWIEIKEDACSADGKNFNYTYTRRIDEGPLIIAQAADQKLWLVQQYRHPIKKIVWQFPSEGKLAGESWQQAAERGLSEELQLVATDWKDLGTFYPDPGGLEQKYHAFMATGLSTAEKIVQNHAEDEVEQLRIQAFTLTEIDQMISTGEICDNWTLAGLYLYQRK